MLILQLTSKKKESELEGLFIKLLNSAYKVLL